jgi:hypothetical protein
MARSAKTDHSALAVADNGCDTTYSQRRVERSCTLGNSAACATAASRIGADASCRRRAGHPAAASRRRERRGRHSQRHEPRGVHRAPSCSSQKQASAHAVRRRCGTGTGRPTPDDARPVHRLGAHRRPPALPLRKDSPRRGCAARRRVDITSTPPNRAERPALPTMSTLRADEPARWSGVSRSCAVR